MPEIHLHLKQTGFTYIACWPFNNDTERRQKLRETLFYSYIYRNELDKSCF